MKSTIALNCALLLAVLAGFAPAPAIGQTDASGQATGKMLAEITAADTAAFDAFNKCKDPAELKKHAGYFAPDVEFYHDQGGVMWNRDEMIAKTAQNVCGKYSRELVAGSMKVYPVNQYGAIETGVHRFCHFASGKCEGQADYLIVWRFKDSKWEMTRVMSYGHRGM
jgi:hypothetical protein